MSEAPVRPLRALSLDGGGMRGIYTAAFLDRLLSQHAKRAGHGPLDLGGGIDLICGTSTGAIVACAVAIGCPLDRVVDLYRQHGRRIFPLASPVIHSGRAAPFLSPFWPAITTRPSCGVDPRRLQQGSGDPSSGRSFPGC